MIRRTMISKPRGANHRNLKLLNFKVPYSLNT